MHRDDLYEKRVRSVCRSCAADMFWTRTDNGRLMPVDWEPSENGNVECYVDADGKIRSRIVTDSYAFSLLGDRTLFMSHFVTCPQAKDWRR